MNKIIILFCCFLVGCAKTSPTESIVDSINTTITESVSVVKNTTTLDQCKSTCTAQLNQVKAQVESLKSAHKAELTSEQKDARFWFCAFCVSFGLIILFVLYKIKSFLV